MDFIFMLVILFKNKNIYHKIMNLIKRETINVQELVSKDSNLSITLQTRLVEKLQNTFNEEEQRWYIGNLYMYMNYHPTE